MTNTNGASPPPLFTVRTLLILTVAVLAGAVIGALTWCNGATVPTAITAALTATGATAVGLHQVVGR